MTLTESEIREAAESIANEIIESARNSVEPVAWVTGNSFMPPMRSFTQAEYVWQNGDDEGEDWEFLVETVEDILSRENVSLECPEWDNALYAVDLNRWEYVEDAEGDSLNDEWRQVNQDSWVSPIPDESGRDSEITDL